MMKPSREEVIRLAHETGCLDEAHYGSVWAERLGCFASAIYSKGFAAGAEDMRERAAVAVNGFTIQTWIDGRKVYAQAVIRALPITPTNQGEQG